MVCFLQYLDIVQAVSKILAAVNTQLCKLKKMVQLSGSLKVFGELYIVGKTYGFIH